jgi:putative Mg2+ transporter-C (MgtC) family protein
MSSSPVDNEMWQHVGQLGLALVLCALIGLERELRAKSAGLRTHTLVGLGAALLMLVSKFGFSDIIGQSHVVLDPSRVAAQVVSGIGFIGGGLIFVRGDAVRGLTTAATVWLTAAVGMAVGSGLWLLALAATSGHFVVAFGFPAISRRLPTSAVAASRLDLVYVSGAGTLSRALEEATRRGFVVAQVIVDPPGIREGWQSGAVVEALDSEVRHVRFTVTGKNAVADLAVAIERLEGVLQVRAVDANAEVE